MVISSLRHLILVLHLSVPTWLLNRELFHIASTLSIGKVTDNSNYNGSQNTPQLCRLNGTRTQNPIKKGLHIYYINLDHSHSKRLQGVSTAHCMPHPFSQALAIQKA